MRNIKKVEGDRLEMEMDKNYSLTVWMILSFSSFDASQQLISNPQSRPDANGWFIPPPPKQFMLIFFTGVKPGEVRRCRNKFVLKSSSGNTLWYSMCVSQDGRGKKNQGDSAFTPKLHSIRKNLPPTFCFSCSPKKKKKWKPPSTLNSHFIFQEGIWPHCVTRWNISVISAVCFPSQLG